MTDTVLRQHLYIALAFQSLVLSREDMRSTDTSKNVIKLAQQISDFCNLYAPFVNELAAVNLVNETGTEEIDSAIEAIIKDRRDDKPIILTGDHETRLKLYDRLQHRAAQRINRLFFAQVTEEMLTKHILSQVDAEIEDRGLLS